MNVTRYTFRIKQRVHLVISLQIDPDIEEVHALPIPYWIPFKKNTEIKM